MPPPAVVAPKAPATHRFRGHTPLQSRAAAYTVPSLSNSPAPAPAASTKPGAQQCPNEDCDESDVQTSEGQLMCFSCGTVLDDSNFVNDVDFAETSAGAAVVQGSYIAGDKRFASTMGGRSRRAGGGMTSSEIAIGKGRDEVRKIGFLLRLGESIIEAGSVMYQMCVRLNLIQGRRIRTVAACCLYMACRQMDHDGALRYVLLIDFADAITINVYRLGQAYADLRKALYMDYTPSKKNPNDPRPRPDRPLAPVIEIEDLILRYAKKLEFHEGEQKVANDAARIMRRMKRDWIVTGRIPSGIIGACLILAARMNNYRRTIREVVYIVKAGNPTISKRIEEFTRTTAGKLSIDDFRSYSDRMRDTAIPPSVYEQNERNLKKRSHSEVDETEKSSPSQSPPQDEAEIRRDADGFAIPAVPTAAGNRAAQNESEPASRESSAALSEDSSSQPSSKRLKRSNEKREYKKKLARFQHIVTHEDLDAEANLENEITQILTDPQVFANMSEDRFFDYKESARRLAAARREAERQGRQLKRPYSVAERELDARILGGLPGNAHGDAFPENTFDIDASEIAAGEFDDDPEVKNCLLSDADSNAKEKIWISQNEDWLRTQQRKALKALVDETTAAQNPEAASQKGQKRKRGRIGDGSLLQDGREPPKDATEATIRMLDRRAPKSWSKFVDIERYRSAFEKTPSAASSDAGSSPPPSDRGFVTPSRSVTPAPAATPASGRGRRSESIISITGEDEPPVRSASPPARRDRKRMKFTLPTKPSRGISSGQKVARDSIANIVGENDVKEWIEEEDDDEEDEEEDEEEAEEMEDYDEDEDNNDSNNVYEDEEDVGFSEGEFD